MLIDAQISFNQVFFWRSVPPELLRSFLLLVIHLYPTSSILYSVCSRARGCLEQDTSFCHIHHTQSTWNFETTPSWQIICLHVTHVTQQRNFSAKNTVPIRSHIAHFKSYDIEIHSYEVEGGSALGLQALKYFQIWLIYVQYPKYV